MGSELRQLLKEVAIYFRDFLETDFHKRRIPKRFFKSRNDNNLLIGIKLDKYPKFSALVWKLINHNFDSSVLSQLNKGLYRADIPQDLLNLIDTRLWNVLSEANLPNLAKKIADHLLDHCNKCDGNYDLAIEGVFNHATTMVRENIASPLVSTISSSFKQRGLASEDDLSIMEEYLAEALIGPLREILETLVTSCLANEEDTPEAQLGSVLAAEELGSTISLFFDSYRIADLFLELFELFRNKGVTEGQEIYLYFGDISYKNYTYPIFYIPVELRQDGESLLFDFDSHIFINKKALDFVTQEYCKETGANGSLASIKERIIYLADLENGLASFLQEIIDEMVTFFGIEGSINVRDQENQIRRSRHVKMTNNTYFSLFDKADEAVVNDYEEILRLLGLDVSDLVNSFEEIIRSFIEDEPKTFVRDIEDEWDNTSTPDKLVIESPIPLNQEQRQILMAVKQDGCRYLTVEGPPGTGKSHTITAIVCDAVLNNKSVLVLSDKNEALDVVEDKITTTLNKIRHDRNFQNPILRLGRSGSSYSQILSNASIGRIKSHFLAQKTHHSELKQKIKSSVYSLKEEIEVELLIGSNFTIPDIVKILEFEEELSKLHLPIDINELLQNADSSGDLDDFRLVTLDIRNKVGEDGENLPRFFPKTATLFGTIKIENISFLERLSRYCKSMLGVHIQLAESYDSLSFLDSHEWFSDSSYQTFIGFFNEYTELNSEFLGRLKWWRRKDIDRRFRLEFPMSNIDLPSQSIGVVRRSVEFIKKAIELLHTVSECPVDNADYLGTLRLLFLDPDLRDEFYKLGNISIILQQVYDKAKYYPSTISALGLNPMTLSSLCNNELTCMPNDRFDNLIFYLSSIPKLEDKLKALLSLDYFKRKRELEELITMEMTYRLDGQVIDFIENYQATARTLRTIIQKKQRFPKEEFQKLKDAFPCILASIRDYAEYIPLQSGLFDLVIIDEASQVSIAQAFPAILRARKVLVLGDKKQFSNVKAAHARNDINVEHTERIKTYFTKNISRDAGKLVRIKMFNITNSILDFFGYINNFTIQLNKYFRGYREIIGYSNKFFYGNTLQVMKIRGCPINDVLKFSFIDHDGKVEPFPNTNQQEVDFIKEELMRLKAHECSLSVGIITPHTNQQKYLIEAINNMPDREWFYDKLRLKIMTFDTCQGEERDLIYYSMVAHAGSDRLWGVFIKDLDAFDVEESGSIKVQRLNVGFSRARECMHFVLSKPIDNFNGAIKQALEHYSREIKISQSEPTLEEVDPNSPMEKEVLQWILNTPFWKKYRDTGQADLKPQFDIGSYLKQIDPLYNHPIYKVDFLLTFRDDRNGIHRIVIEYDGFKEHFINHENVNAHNYDQYFTENDVLRQKIIESYGYRFLRINRFNIGNDPVLTIEQRIRSLIENSPEGNHLLQKVQTVFDDLESKNVKECPKCREIRAVEDFEDRDLLSGVGRICLYCKGKKSVDQTRQNELRTPSASMPACPRCGAKMMRRIRRHDGHAFYGCSRYPACRGTKNIS